MHLNKKVTAIIPAGGVGERMKMKLPKQFVNVNNKPIIAYTIDAISRCKYVEEIIVAVPDGYIPYFNDVVKEFELTKVKRVLCGGASRQETVYKCLSDGIKTDFVLVHDSVRPLINADIIKTAVNDAYEYGASAVGVTSTDTIKIADEDGFIFETIDRNKVWQIQTPQIFKTEILIEAHKKAIDTGFTATDDCRLVENIGHKIKLVLNDSVNTKITYKDDLKILEAFFNEL